MQAAVLYGKEKLRVERVAVPQVGPRDVLVKVRTALTCGTDLKVFRRGHHARMIKPPALFGHELAGDVVAVGEDVTRFRPGQRIVAANSAPCGDCYYCRRGRENLCEDLLFNNGAYAQYMRIPERIVEKNSYEIPAGVRLSRRRHGRALGLRAARHRGFRDPRRRHGGRHRSRPDRADVRTSGEARRSERDSPSAADANSSSAPNAWGPPIWWSPAPARSRRNAVRAATEGGRGADVVIEAVGSPHAWRGAVQMVRSGGVVNFFGGCPKDTQVCLDTSLLHYSELTLKASFHHTPRHIQRSLDIVKNGGIHGPDFVIDEAPLGDLLKVFRHMMSHNGHLKTAILPHE